MTSNVEIICVGNELLIGKTLNTNAHWLAKKTTTLGLHVKKITVIGDDINEISSAVKEALMRKPRFIVTTGGLGPTFDDKTLEGIAKALNRKLEENEEALRMVKEKYKQYVAEGRMDKFEMTPHRVKMATLPEGSKPLRNPVGTAPGVLIELADTTLIILPGVPDEMKAIFEESVEPMFKKAAGNLMFFEASIEVWGVPESAIAPLIDKVMKRNPYVYIKSHPRAAERIPHIELHLSTTSDSSEEARKKVSTVLMQISELIQKEGGKITPTKVGA